MSRAIDNAVVSMQFDNKGFESNVQTSLGTIGRLKQSLSSLGSTKALDNLSASAKGFHLNPVSSAVETVGLKFNALYTIADAALRNMVNSAINAGKRIASALTIDPIKTGFQEYETQINAVQTILANTESKGSTLTDVNAALDELNTYADKTIYNFTEMTKNIGTFTAAGVELETAVNSIKGIANLAAVSGSTSQQASTAMYQLSQALASGTVKLMDWNSVVNAGMGGQVFQDALKETARVHGVAIDKMIQKEGSFRETLSKGWLTSEILTETLEKFTLSTENMTKAEIEANRARLKSIGYTDSQIDGIFKLGNTATNAATKVKTFTQLLDTTKEAAQSGWTQSWEYIVGDFEEAKTMWTKVSDELGGIIGRSADKRNNLLEGAMTSNWDKLIKKLNEDGVETKVFEDNLRKVFEGQKQYDLDFLLETYGSYENIFRKGAAPAELLTKALMSSNSALQEHKKHVVQAGDTLSGLAKKYGVTVDELVKWNKIKDKNLIIDGETLIVSNEATAENIALTNRQIKSYKDLIAALGDKSGRELLMESAGNIYKGIKSVVTPIKKAWGEVFKPITSEQLYGFLEKTSEFTRGLKLNATQTAKLKTTFKGLFSVLGIGKDAISGLAKGIAPAFGLLTGFGDKALDVSSSLGKWLTNLRQTIKESGFFEKAGTKIAEGITTVRTKLSEFGKPIWEWFFGPKDAEPGYVTGFQKFVTDVKKFIDETGAMDYVKDKWEGAKKSVTGFFQNAKKYIDATGITGMISDKFTSIGEKIKGFFQSVKDEGLNFGEILGRIKTNISEFVKGLSFDKIKESFSNFKSAIAENLEASGLKFDGFKEKLSTVVDFIKSAIPAVLGIASGILLFKGIGKVWSFVKDIGSFIAGFGELMQGASSWMKAKAFSERVEAITDALKSLAILAGAIAILSTMDQGDVWSSVGAISALFGFVAIMAGLMSKLDSIDKFGDASGSILKMAGAILMLTGAVALLGNMKGETLFKGELALAGLLGMMVGMMAATKLISDKDIHQFGKLMSSLGVALLLMSASVGILGNMKLGTLVKGELAIAGLLGMVVGMAAATKLISDKDIRAFGKLMTSLGIGLLAMSAAVGILGNMDTSTIVKGELAIAGLLGMMVGMAAATKLLSERDIGKFGAMMSSLGAALLLMSLAVAILGNMDTSTIVKGELAIAGIMAMFAGMMAATKLLGSNTADIAKFGLTMLAFSGAMLILAGAIGILSMISPSKLAGATAAIVAVGAMFIGLLAITKMVNTKTIGTLLVMTGAVAVMAGMIYLLATLPVENCLGAALSLTAVLLGVAGALFALGKIPTVGLMKGMAAVAVIAIGVAAIAAAVAGIAMLVISGLPKVGENLSSFMDNLGGFLDGAANIKPEALEGVKTLAEVIGMLAVANIIDKIGSFGGLGKSSLERFGEQLTPFGEALSEFNKSISSISVEDAKKISEVAGSVKILAEAANMARTGFKEVGWGAYANVTSLSGFSEWMREALPVLGDFATDISGIDNLNIEGIESVVAAVKGFAEAANIAKTETNVSGYGSYINVESLGGFSKWLSSSLPVITKFAKDLSIDENGKALKINTGNISAIVDAVKGLAEAANAARIDTKLVGLGAIYADVSSLSEFAGWLKTVVPILKQFALDVSFGEDGKKLGNFNYKNMTAITDAARTLAEAANYASTQHVDVAAGLIFTKTENLAPFSAWLKSATGTLKQLAFDVTFDEKGGKLPDFNYGNLTALADAAKTLAEAANYAATQHVDVAAGLVFTKTENLAPFLPWLKSTTTTLRQFAVDVSFDEKGGKLPDFNYDNLAALADAAKTLAEAAKYAATQYVDVGAGLLYTKTENLAPFSAWLKNALPAISQFAIDLSFDKGGKSTKINTDAVGKVAEAVKTLADAANTAQTNYVEIAGGLYTETSDLGAFAQWIKDALPEISKFAVDISSIDGIDTDGIGEVAKVADTLMQAAALAPKKETYDFKIVEIISETELTEFSEWIGGVTDALAGFAKSVSSGDVAIDANAVTAVANAGKILAEMANIMPTEGGLSKIFAGETNWNDFGNNLVTFGNKMRAFSKAITKDEGINAEAVTAVSNSGLALAQMMQIVQYAGGFGEGDVEDFSNNVEAIADVMNQFSNKVAEINTEAITAASGSAQALVNVMTTLLTTSFVNLDTATFSAKCGEVATAMTTFASNMEGVNVTGAVSALSSLTNTLSTISSTNFSGADSLKKALEELSTTSIDDVVSAFNDAGPKITEAAQAMLDGFVDTIEGGAGDAETAGTTVGESAVSGLDSAASGASTAGTNFVAGFCGAVAAGTDLAAAAGAALGAAALEAAKAALDEESPSKAMYEVGDFAVIGFVNAFKDGMTTSYNSSYETASAAVDGMSDALTRIQDAITSDIDTQPTIRPIIDLSDVTAGANSINSMFGMRPSVRTLSNVGAINSMMSRNQNRGDRAIVSAIEDLSSRLGNTSGDTYQINGITYDDGSNISSTVRELVRAVRIERRI